MPANIKNTAVWIAGFLFSLGLMFSPAGFARDIRPLPASGILGTLKQSAMPTVVIDQQVYTLTAGAQIRNQQNMIVQTGSISGPDVKILYKKASSGQIDRIWILTDDEYQRISTGAKPNALRPVLKTGN